MRTTRTRVAFGAATLAAAALITGCSAASEVRQAVDTASTSVDVCNEGAEASNKTFATIGDATTKAGAGDEANLKKTITTEFEALHKTLSGLLAKNIEPEVKTALQSVDTNVSAWSADPDKWLAYTQKELDVLTGNLNKACNAK
jgi:hypothetical protein